MALSGLADASRAFVGERTGVGEPVYFLLHVPKTAGQTINGHVRAYLSPSAYYRPRKRRGVGRLFLSIHDIRDMPDPEGLRVLTGHYLSRSLESHFAGREIHRTALLRNPLSHVLSYYNFRMMRYRSKGQGAYEFDVAYRAAPRNQVSHFLLNKYLEISWARLCVMPVEEQYDLLNRWLRDFWFVADYKRCDDLIVSLGEALDLPQQAVRKNTSAQWQKRVEWAPLTADDLSEAQRSRIVNDNILDQMLWETWRDAGHEAARVRPKALPGKSGRAFIVNEALRPWYQVQRRLKRATGAVSAANRGGASARESS